MNFKFWLVEEESSNREYWGPISYATKEGDYLKITADMLDKPLYIPYSDEVAYVNQYPKNKTLNPPWNKYFRYSVAPDGKYVVNYVENRAVDCLCYSPKYNAVYLIDRKAPPFGIAIPGGFFDTHDGINVNNPSDPQTIGAVTAARELEEETGAKVSASDLSYIGRFRTDASDTREKNFYIWAYFYIVPDDMIHDFKFGDDAGQAPGSPSLQREGLNGWYEVDNIPNLVFPHHYDIIKTAMNNLVNQRESK
jgi:ADP-ribose pyrophosphatase YjhB (NUDIX family)